MKLVELKEKIIQKLKEVIDPGTLSDIVSMGLVKKRYPLSFNLPPMSAHWFSLWPLTFKRL